MWDNPRLLNIVAGALVGVAMLFFAAAGFVYLVRSPLSPVREVVVTTELKKTTRQQVESAVRATPGGNFFAYSLPALRPNLESLPCRRRPEPPLVWPDLIDSQID